MGRSRPSLLNAPNAVTLLRVLLLPAFICAFRAGGKTGLFVALALALFFELTDTLDGAVARRFSAVSDLGKLLDPLADTLTRFTIFLTFLASGLVPLWMVVLLFFRDMTVAYIRVGAAVRGVVLAARASGKIKAVFQGAGIFAVLAVLLAREYGYEPFPHRDAVWWIMLAVTLVTLWSLYDYARAFLSMPEAGRKT
jgi:CDP-diacylglycerol--glycerol-3-phosphate 3-phosphatidyltransferase